jgi:hypothetical protein
MCRSQKARRCGGLFDSLVLIVAVNAPNRDCTAFKQM